MKYLENVNIINFFRTFDTFDEVLPIFWLMKVHGLVQFLVIGTVGNRKLVISKNLHVYSILVFICCIIVQVIWTVNVIHNSDALLMTGVIIIIKSSLLTFFVMCSLFQNAEIPIVFKKLSNFDREMVQINFIYKRNSI